MAKGFNRGPQMGGGGMMGQIKRMQEQMAQAQAKLAEQTVTGSSGGGAVKVTVTGDQRCTAVEVDPEFLKDADAEMLQDMLLTAVNQALENSKKMADEAMGPLAGGLSGLGF